jgi:hypothetical protein
VEEGISLTRDDDPEDQERWQQQVHWGEAVERIAPVDR